MAYNMGSEAFDYSKYDLDEALNYFAPSAAAEPVRKPAPKKEPVVKTSGLNIEVERSAKTVAVNTYVKQGVAFFAVAIFCAVVLLFMRTQCNDLDRQIADLNVKISNESSETIRLNSELNAMLSSEEIEKYAEKNGMIKAESYQVSYIDLSEGDTIVVSGDKDVSQGSGFMQKIADFFAYIF